MSGYRALDLGGLCTTSGEVFQDPETVPRGELRFHGLPFTVGAGTGPVADYLVLGPRFTPSVRVPVGGRPTWLVFAHALLDSDLFEGGSLGQVCAEYTLVYADGVRHVLPIRERFEVAVSPQDHPGRPIPLDWGQTPFLALPDLEPLRPHRTLGRFDGAAGRFKDVDDPSTRVPYVLPYRFFLWPLENPRPGAELDHLELSSLGPALVVAGVTVSDLAEEPFSRTVYQDIRVRLPAPGGSPSRPYDIEQLLVDVERGTASFPYWTVPDGDAAAGGEDVVPGWGQQPAAEPATAHVRIAASPSASVTVAHAGAELATVGWGELLEAGCLEAAGTVFEVLEPGRTWVRTVVRDQATGLPVPCRIHFHSTAGVPLAPHGHPVHINSGLRTHGLDIGGDLRLGGRTYAYIDGTCEGWLPIGDVVVEVARGFEYEPVRHQVRVTAGMGELVLTIQRFDDLSARGYFSGDTHVHFVSTMGAELEARCEDLRVVNVLRTQGAELFTVTEEFTGRPHVSADGSTHVYVSQENRTGMFGHINLLGLRRPVAPLSTGGPDESEVGGGLETGLSHWADECHAQGGTAILAHFPVPNGEAAALIATGRLDAIEMVAHDPYNLGEYYRYLDHGYRIPLVGGTDKMTSEVPVGLVRTYVRVPEPFDYFGWAAAIRGGDMFTSSGPLLEATFDGHPPGSGIAVSGSVSVAISMRSIFPVDRIEVVGRAGAVLASAALDGPVCEWAGELRVDVPVDTWLAVRCYGPDERPHHDIWRRPVTAHTSPVYLRRGAEYSVRSPGTADYMLTLIDGAVEHIRLRSRRFWPGPVTHRHGQSDHLAYLLAPYEEARQVIRDRV